MPLAGEAQDDNGWLPQAAELIGGRKLRRALGPALMIVSCDRA